MVIVLLLGTGSFLAISPDRGSATGAMAAIKDPATPTPITAATATPTPIIGDDIVCVDKSKVNEPPVPQGILDRLGYDEVPDPQEMEGFRCRPGVASSDANPNPHAHG